MTRCLIISILVGDIMGQMKPLFVVLIFSCATLSGCIFSSKDDSSIDLVVDYDSDNGTIVESYSQGDLISTTEVIISFDFSNTISAIDLATYLVDPMDGRDVFSIDAKSGSQIDVGFADHGIYDVVATAVDSNGYQISKTISIRIDLRIDWVELDTNNPTAVPFDPQPKNNGTHATMIEINSVVENPSLTGSLGDSGQTIQLTWYLMDELGDICQSRDGQASDGDSITWQTIYFNTFMEHEFRIELDDSQDAVNIEQSISILYEND